VKVEVGIMMKKLQLFLAGGAILFVLACSTTSSVDPKELFNAAPANTPDSGAMLVGLDAEIAPTPKVIVHTSQEPVYSSYAPQPGEFVIDFPGMTKSGQLTTPTNLPSNVTSVSAEETVELGSPLTRVTLHYVGDAAPTAIAENDAVIVTFEGVSGATTSVASAPDVAPGPTASEPAPEAEPTMVATADPIVTSEPVDSTPPPAAAPAPMPTPVRKVAIPSHPASALESVRSAGHGDSLTIALEADGTLEYKAFRLDNPLRLVIDLDGIRNEVPGGTINIDDARVERVRVGQFQSTPTPIARVVFDLASQVDYQVHEGPEGLVVSFGREAARTAAMNVQAAKVAASETNDPAPVAKPTPSAVVPIASASTDDAAPMVPVVTPPTQVLRAPRPSPSPQEAPPPPDTPVAKKALTISGGSMAPGSSRTLTPGEKVYTGEPISIDMTNSDLKDVLRLFSELTGLNMAIDPQVAGTVTVRFENVPWDQALDLILKQNSLTYTLQGNVMRIGTIDRLTKEQEATNKLEEQEKLNVPLSTVIKYLSYAKAADVQAILQAMASPRGKIIVDQRTNQLIISEIPAYLQTMLNLIETIDIPTPQVVIEARIVETTKNFAQQLGIAWGFTGALDPALGTGTGLVFPNRVNVTGGPFDFSTGNPVLDMSFGNVMGTFDLDVLLTAAESEGLVKIVSAPKVTTQDNQSASIESGVQIPVQTRVNFTTTVTYVNATLQLQVTPQVTAEGTVIMEISVQKVEPALGLSVVGAANSPLLTRRAQTKLMVRDGETTVIGGIYQATDNSAQSRVPFLHSIPVIGNLFKNRDVNSRHDELLIFITPRIVRNT